MGYMDNANIIQANLHKYLYHVYLSFVEARGGVFNEPQRFWASRRAPDVEGVRDYATQTQK